MWRNGAENHTRRKLGDNARDIIESFVASACLGRLQKKGQSIDLFGKEDAFICREAGEFWNEETTDGYPSMRARIDADLAAVADEIDSKGITWNYRDVQRLIIPYPQRKEVDDRLERLGEDFYHDAIEEECQNEEQETNAAVAETGAEENQGELSSSSSESEAEVDAAVADNKKAAVAASESKHVEEVPLSVEQADAVHQGSCFIAALETTIENLR